MSPRLNPITRLLAALTLAGAIAALTGSQALAGGGSKPSPDKGGWYQYATASPARLISVGVSDVENTLQVARHKQARAVAQAHTVAPGANTDGWYYHFAVYPEAIAGTIPVSDVENSLQVARIDNGVGAAPVSATTAPSDNPFDWTAAALGAAATLGLLLLLGLAGSLALRRRSRLVI